MPKLNYPHLASMVFNTPLMCTPALLHGIEKTLAPRLFGAAPLVISNDYFGEDDDETEDDDEEGDDFSVSSGIAVIPVQGILTPRRGSIDGACREITSYELLAAKLDAALNNDAVEHIVLDLNSQGGAATGCFEYADKVFQARQQKPITAIVNFMAASACYAIASAADEIVVSQSSVVGSIGVIASHVDMSKALADEGLKITTVYRGDRKNDLNPAEPISDGALKALNDSLDMFYGNFVDSVARYRNISTQSVRDTQAGVFYGASAIANKLADRMATPQQAINQIAQQLASRKRVITPQRRIGLQAAAMNLSI